MALAPVAGRSCKPELRQYHPGRPAVIFEHSEETKHLIDRVRRFMDEHVYPSLETYRPARPPPEAARTVWPKRRTPSAEGRLT